MARTQPMSGRRRRREERKSEPQMKKRKAARMPKVAEGKQDQEEGEGTFQRKGAPTSKGPSRDNLIGWKKPNDLSDKWSALETKMESDLTICSWNLCGLGSQVKRKDIGRVLEEVNCDICTITEHHKEVDEFTVGSNDSLNRKDMSIPGYRIYAKHRGMQKKGGVAIAWKAGLNVSPWVGAKIPEGMEVKGLERCWVKVPSKPQDLYVGTVYMPTEGNNKACKDFTEILEILELDLLEIEKAKGKAILYGDFNAHIGNPRESDYGIEGNNAGIGLNGGALIEWLQKWDRIVVNAVPGAKGLWTRQRGISKSVLDLMVCGNSDVSRVKAFLVDDERELCGGVRTDHNLLVSLVKASYNRIVWTRPPSQKWDFSSTDRKCFSSTYQE